MLKFYKYLIQISLFSVMLCNTTLHGQSLSILADELAHHIESNDFEDPLVLFKDYEKGIKEGFNSYKMTIARQTALQVIKKQSKFLSFSLPIIDGKNGTLYLKRRVLSDADFKIIIQNTDSRQQMIESPEYLAYSGVIQNHGANSLVSVIIYDNTFAGIIFIGDKQYTLSLINKSKGEYELYENSMKVMHAEFKCGVNDYQNDNLKNSIAQNNLQTTIPKCIKLHFEITKSLNDQFGGVNQSILQFLSIFNITQTKFSNDGISVRISYLKIWDTADPYYQSWYGNPGDPGAFQDLGYQSFQQFGGNINGNIGMLLSTFSGGIAGLAGGAACPNQGYAAVHIYDSQPQNIITIMHEIGHNLGSHHTHWCGWPGGAIDNCYPTEGGCPQGPYPVNGGTIMSYCGDYWNITNNGFGTLPKNVILDYIENENCITSCESEITCEDNIVSLLSTTSTSSDSFTVNWASDYAVKVYFKEIGAADFTLLSTVSQPTNNYTINFTPSADCSIQKFEIKLVSVCPNGDSKPTVLVYSPQRHLKPYAGIFDNYLCNIQTPTFNDLVVSGQDLKFYATETGGVPLSSTTVIPTNIAVYYYVSQTVNGCESERTLITVNIQNVLTPSGMATQQFYCSTPKTSDLEINGTNVLWWTAPIGGLSPNVNDTLQHNTYYYAESRSANSLCVSPQRFPVLVLITPDSNPPYTVPFTETFDSKLCNLGYTSISGSNASGSEADNGLRVATFGSAGRVFTKAIYLVGGVPIRINFKVKNYNNPQNEALVTKIGSDLIYNNQFLLGSVIPTSNNTYSSVTYNFTPATTGMHYVSFDFASSAYYRGVYIDDFSITSTIISIVGQNIGIPWETDIDLTTTDGTIYSLQNYNLPAGEFKFRQDHSWVTNWGGSVNTGTFPTSIGVQDGANITAVAGTYDVTFNRITGLYNFVASLGINENILSKFLIYPNPANNIVYIETPEAVIKSVSIYDVLGRLIKSGEVGNSKYNIDIHELPNSIYLLNISTNFGNKTVKIIKN